MMREGTFWRYAASILGVILGLSVIINMTGVLEIPRQITLFLFGMLIALAVGYTIVNPNASLTRLAPAKEKEYRKRQYIVCVGLSTFLAALMIVNEIRNSLLVWIIVPILALPIVLLIREHLMSERNIVSRKRKSTVKAVQAPSRSSASKNRMETDA